MVRRQARRQIGLSGISVLVFFLDSFSVLMDVNAIGRTEASEFELSEESEMERAEVEDSTSAELLMFGITSVEMPAFGNTSVEIMGFIGHFGLWSALFH
jgi:hypothetical protein